MIPTIALVHRPGFVCRGAAHCSFLRKLPVRGSPTVRAESKVIGYQVPVDIVGVENDSLSLPEHAERRTLERSGSKLDLVAVITTDNTDSAGGIVCLDHTLHGQAFCTFPALRHDVQTRTRLELLPCLTRTRWMLGSQRRLDRL
jgi:hypothetical protein